MVGEYSDLVTHNSCTTDKWLVLTFTYFGGIFLMQTNCEGNVTRVTSPD